MKLVVLALLIGCSSPAKQQPMEPMPVAGADDPSCPLLVAGTSITVEDTPEGPSFVFVTTGDIAAVRTRGGALATMHNKRNGPKSALGMMFTAGSEAKAADIEGGVRVTFMAAEAGELRAHAMHMAGASSCEMH